MLVRYRVRFHQDTLILRNTLPNRSQAFLTYHFSRKIVCYNKKLFLKLDILLKNDSGKFFTQNGHFVEPTRTSMSQI